MREGQQHDGIDTEITGCSVPSSQSQDGTGVKSCREKKEDEEGPRWAFVDGDLPSRLEKERQKDQDRGRRCFLDVNYEAGPVAARRKAVASRPQEPRPSTSTTATAAVHAHTTW